MADDQEAARAMANHPPIMTLDRGTSGRSFVSGLSSEQDPQDNNPVQLLHILTDGLLLLKEATEEIDKQNHVAGQSSSQQHEAAKKKRDAITEQMWDKVRRWLHRHPYPEQRQAAACIRGANEAAVLHLLCKSYYPPIQVIQAMVEAAPDTLTWPDEFGWLPLHHACAVGCSTEVLELLVAANPDAKTHQDKFHRTPLHFYATRNACNASVMQVNASILADSGAAALTDRSGMLPMHYGAAYGTLPVVLEVLAAANPASLTARTNNGRTPMHLAMVNARRDGAPAVISFLLGRATSKATVNSRDNDGYLPLHLLANENAGYRDDVNDPDRKLNVKECLNLYLSADPFSSQKKSFPSPGGGGGGSNSADFLTAIQDLPDWLKETAVVSKHVRNILNDKIVQRFPTFIIFLDGYLLLLLIACFEITTKKHIDMIFTNNDGGGINTTTTVADTTSDAWALTLVIVCATYFLLRELIQIVSLFSLQGHLRSWWTDSGNWLDLAVIVLVYYFGILMVGDGPGYLLSPESFRIGVAFTKGVLWMAVIFFLKSTYIGFAVFVSGCFYVVQRLTAFVIAIGVILVAFAQMFYFIYVNNPDTDQQCTGQATDITTFDSCPGDGGFPHCSFGFSVLKVYTMMMGEIGEQQRYEGMVLSQILYVAYAFLVVILLSNVLIAIVTDSYEIIKNDRAAIVFWSNRLDFVAEMDAIRYAVIRGLRCFRSPSADDANSANHRQSRRSPSDPPEESLGDDRNGTNNNVPELSQQAFPNLSSTDYFRVAWRYMMELFGTDMYDEADWPEFCAYHLFKIICVFLIPLWLLIGLASCGVLWPPQVREFLFVQKETPITRAERERKKLQELKAIQTDVKSSSQDLIRELSNDQDEMLRVRADMDAVQDEVLADLQQVKELMVTLMGDS